MELQNNDLSRLVDAVEQIRSHLLRLDSRVAELERSVAEGGAGSEQAKTARPAALDSETMMALGAAVAAYLGEKPRIRSIRLLRSGAWAQEGRTTIQAWYSVSPPPTT